MSQTYPVTCGAAVHSTHGRLGGKLSGASGTYGTQEAGTRTPQVRHGCGTLWLHVYTAGDNAADDVGGDLVRVGARASARARGRVRGRVKVRGRGRGRVRRCWGTAQMSAWTMSMVLRSSDDGFRISFISGAEANIVKNGAKKPNHLGCHGTRYIWHTRW